MLIIYLLKCLLLLFASYRLFINLVNKDYHKFHHSWLTEMLEFSVVICSTLSILTAPSSVRLCLIFRAFALYVSCLFLIATSFLVNKDQYITVWSGLTGFLHQSGNWLGKSSPKWPIIRRVGRWTLQCHILQQSREWVDGSWVKWVTKIGWVTWVMGH